MSNIINDLIEMRNFTSEGITVAETYTLPSGIVKATVEIWAAGDFSSSSEYIIAKVDGVQIDGKLSTGSDGATMKNLITYDLTALIGKKQIIELSVTTTSSMNPNVGVSGGTSCWVDWRFEFEVSIAKLLIEDGSEVKAWNDANGTYEKVGDMPLTQEMFLNFGMENVPKSSDGIVSNIPKLHLYTQDESVIGAPQLYKLKLIEKKLSLPKIVVENTGRILQEKISSIIIGDSVNGTGDLQYALSKDKITWYVFDTVNSVWQVIDITDDTEFFAKGMRKADFGVVTDINYEEIFQIGDELYLAFRFYKGLETDECKFLNIRLNYTSPIDTII